MENKIKEGEVLFADGKIEEAEKMFLSVVENDSKNKEAHNNLGVIAIQKEDVKEAINCFTRALEIDPFFKDAIINYVDLLKALNQPLVAVPLLKKFLEMDPNDKEVDKLLENLSSPIKVHPKIAVICAAGLETFLKDIAEYLKNKYDARVCYSVNVQEIDSTIKWSDIVWLEWANELTIALTNHKENILKDKRVICRLHSYEAFEDFAGKINWENISDLIFVAEHIKNIVLQQVPKLPDIVKNIHVIPNGVDIDKFSFRNMTRGKNLAFVGELNYKKGPMLLLHAFRELVQRDSEYRLFIAGKFEDARYQLYFQHMIQEMGLEGNVQLDGWIKDINTWLEDKQYIVCSSVLEGHPVGIMEAMARGLKPVIHNFVGARGIYPVKYIWNTIPDFVRLVESDDYNSMEYRRFIEEHYTTTIQMGKIEGIIRCLSQNSNGNKPKERISPEATEHESRCVIPLPEETYSSMQETRQRANQTLGQELFKKGNLGKAKTFVTRALVQSNFLDENTFRLYIDIHKGLKDYHAIREAYKRRAVNEMQRGNPDLALIFFELSINASYHLSGTYDIPIDSDITYYIQTMAESLKSEYTPFAPFKRTKKATRINLGYIIEGFDSSQAPIKNYINYARFHNKKLFNITFYSRWRPDDKINGVQNYKETIKLIESEGHQVVVSPPLPTQLERILSLFQKIKEDEIDILSTSSLYTVPHIHLLCAMKPALFLVKDVLQQPELSPFPDLTIHHSTRTFVEDIGRCVCLGSRYIRPSIKKIVDKSDWGIPNDSVLLVSSGRGQKFISTAFWNCIGHILSNCPHAYFMAIGLSEQEIKLRDILGQEAKKRIILPGFRDDVYELLKAADICIDTFPQGGGYSLVEAMFAGLPCVMFESDYWQLFEVRNSTYSELLSIPELIVPRWDYDELIKRVIKLVKDSVYRKNMSNLVVAQAGNVLGNYDEYIRNREHAMIDIFYEKVKIDTRLHNSYAELEKSTRKIIRIGAPIL